MKKFVALLLFLAAILLPSASALYKEEAGKLDFLVATTGHGPCRFVHAVGESVITSDAANDSSTSCYVASRRIDDGTLLWRRNVCSSAVASKKAHVVAVSSSIVATLDKSGSVRAWSLDSGSLLWDALIPTTATGRLSIKAAKYDSHDIIVASTKGGGSRIMFDAGTGETLSAPAARELQIVETESSLNAFCPDASILVEFQAEVGGLIAWLSNGEGSKQTRLAESEKLLSSDDSTTTVSLLSCSPVTVSVLVTTLRGTTSQVTFSTENGETRFHAVWRAEEGLAQLSSALMLDASHYVGDTQDIEEEKLLQLSNRLLSQWEGLSTFFLSRAKTNRRRDHTFGFVKVAVLLSSSTGRVFGVGTSGVDQGEIKYQIDLPGGCDWHRLVHGTSNSQSGAYGINGASHSREVLALSSTAKKVYWRCFDGSNGNLHAEGSIIVASPVVQVLPLTGLGPCRQGALLVSKDNSLVSVPAETSFERQIESTKNGLYTHVVESSKVSTMRIVPSDSGLKSIPTGTAVFADEEILSAAYPSREEVVQSPCTVMGDDSLLLKYLNPHIAVFITRSTRSLEEDGSRSALSAKHESRKRKPAGVTSDSTEIGADEAVHNLFVNVLDTASGRVLYRASHANAGFIPSPKAIISENWVVYTFMNDRTRRAELGVLSLVGLRTLMFRCICLATRSQSDNSYLDPARRDD